MGDTERKWIETTNWLAHRWDIELVTQPYGQWVIYAGKVEGHRIGQASDRAEYDRLARFIAGHPAAHPPAVLIVAGDFRLGRIPPELWCGYDVTLLMDLPRLTLLSAKVRALFPAWPKAVIRVVRQDAVAGMGLKPAPGARGPRLRAVA